MVRGWQGDGREAGGEGVAGVLQRFYFRMRAAFGLRRGAPRRYVLRETGESVLNRRIPKGGPRRKARGAIVY